jgi:LAO/AO transport system kinase
VHELGAKVLEGDFRAVARACRLVDDRTSGYLDLLRDLYPHTGAAWWVGVTGGPGAGKSTLVDRLIARFRSEELRVAVVAVDPTSPFSGGAILGDRIRMQRHFQDEEVFIRSVATRGALGGLSRSAVDVARILEAWGAGVVLIETVGVGQDELEVARTAHSTLVVVSPGLGDAVQALKAGVLECADVFAVNKADRPGVDTTVRDLELMIALGSPSMANSRTSRAHSAPSVTPEKSEETSEHWVVPVVRCIATEDSGTSEVLENLKAHRRWLDSSEAGRIRRLARTREQLLGFLRDELVGELSRELEQAIDAAAEAVARRSTDPYTACERLLHEFRGGGLESS